MLWIVTPMCDNGGDNMADIRHLWDGIEHQGLARHGLARYIAELELDREQYGYVRSAVGARAHLLPQAAVMMEATFRLLKHIQHGDSANLRDAALMWVRAARLSGELVGHQEAVLFDSGASAGAGALRPAQLHISGSTTVYDDASYNNHRFAGGRTVDS